LGRRGEESGLGEGAKEFAHWNGGVRGVAVWEGGKEIFLVGRG